jgi:acetyl/propionyl-CoA carboxylase alpha subunit
LEEEMKKEVLENIKEWFDKTDLVELRYWRGKFKIGFIKKNGISNKKISSGLKSIVSDEIGLWSFSKKGKKINIKEGDEIKKGSVLGYINIKDKFKEVISPYDGKIKVICVDDNSIVEWGQILFIVE